MLKRGVAVIGVVIALGAAARMAEQSRPEVAMTRAATELLAALDDAQRAKIQFPFESEERFNWHFIPRERKGLPLKEMSESQREKA